MALLEYDFSIVGASAIDKAFASIERRADQHNRKMASIFAGGGGVRGGRGGGTTVPTASPAAARRSRITEVEKELREKARIEARYARESAANDRRWAREHTRFQAQRVRDAERAAKAETKALIKAQRERAHSVVGSASGSVRGSLRTIGTIGASALALGGGFAVSGAVSQQMRETAMASSLANQAGDPRMKRGLLREAQQVRGFSGEETLSAIGGFVTKTGNLDAARGAIQGLSQLALATGTDFGEMGEAAGQAFNVIADTIKDPKEQLAALQDVMSTLAGQGNLGAVEISDMVRELAGLGAVTRSFEGGPVELLKSMGAIAQAAVARGGAKDAAEATTAVTRFAADIVKSPSQKALAGLGIDVFNKDKTTGARTSLKKPEEIMADILAKTNGDLVQVEEVLNAESKKALKGFSPLYLEAQKKAFEGGATKDAAADAGKKALLDEFARFTDAGLTQGQIKERAQSRLGDADLQFKEAMKDFNREIGSELLPVITKLIPEFVKLIPLLSTGARILGKFIDTLAENPLSTIGALIATKVAADIATAQIGNAVKGAITDSLSGDRSGEGGKRTGSNIGGAVINGLSLGVTGAMAIYASGVVNFESREADLDKGGEELNRLREMGKDTPINIEEARELKRRAQERTEKLEEPGFLGSFLQFSRDLDKSVFGDSAVDAVYGSREETAKTGAELDAYLGRDEGQTRTARAFEAEVADEVRRIELQAAEEAAAIQKKAAEDAAAITVNAAKNAGAAPNRGNAPSPVKS